MTVIIRPPTTPEVDVAPDPLACLHPAAPYSGGFRDPDGNWASVAQYCLANRLLNAEDRQKIRHEYELPKARELAARLPVAPDAKARAFEVLSRGLLLCVEANLRVRRVLLETGDEPIEAHLEDDSVWGVGKEGQGENQLGRALMDVRARVRVRADDPHAIQCLHQDAEELRVVCVHRLGRSEPYRRRFLGVGADYEQLCEACCAALPKDPPRRKVCSACFFGKLEGPRLADLGEPELRERPSLLRFSHRALDLPEDLIALAPVANQPNVWLMLDEKGRFYRVDVDRMSVEEGGRVDPQAVDLSKGVVLAVSPGGDLAAVGEARGVRGVVVEPASGTKLRLLTRGDYHVEHCSFPLGFVEHDGRLLLIHATDWNRLDVSDARTGALLSVREEVGLDYFHSELHLSPEGSWVASNGWCWHPVGVVRVFNVKRWLSGHPTEPEDGPTARALTCREYYWDGPLTWLDENTFALWGEGEDDLELVPAALILDAATGRAVTRFLGPAEGFLSVPPYLISADADRGTEVWDWRTGERLAKDPSFEARWVHPRSHELLSKDAQGGYRVSRLSE